MYRPLIAWIALILLLPACGERHGAKPNVILIVMDTVRADSCTVSGALDDTTPGLIGIAAKGVAFRDAWSPAGWTGPAHVSLFTGRRPETVGYLLGNRLHLETQEHTLAEILEARGYRTVCLTNNTMIGPEFGLTQGFERVLTMNDQEDQSYPTCRWAHREAYRTAREHHDAGQPFFLYVNDMEAHLPYEPIPEWRSASLAFNDAEVQAAMAFNSDDAHDHIMGGKTVSPRMTELLTDLYEEEIRGLDGEILELVNRLESAGILENTILVITSDHGENLGDHGLFAHKASIHRTICRVPLVIRYPGVFDGGRAVEDVVRLEDVMPTILELTGSAVPDDLDGASLVGDTSGRVARGAYGRREGNLEVPEGAPGLDMSRFALSMRSSYDGRHHYIWNSDGSVELYDIVADPAELENLAAGRPEIVAEMERLLSER